MFPKLLCFPYILTACLLQVKTHPYSDIRVCLSDFVMRPFDEQIDQIKGIPPTGKFNVFLFAIRLSYCWVRFKYLGLHMTNFLM